MVRFPPSALRVSVRGVVQGVGFRPFVHRLALRLDLAGWVRNASGDVQVLVEGAPDKIETFVRELRCEAPVLARIDDLCTEPCAVSHLTAFRILDSTAEPGRRQ